jgi:uncharacterized membrane protein HdeD (DUF308 family)
MKKYLPIYLYGAIIMLAGVFLIFSKNSTFNVIKLSLGLTLTVAAILAFIAALSRQRKQVQFAYHEMHALAMMGYGISILLFCNSSEKLISFTAFLLIFYTFSEIIFCNWLFNLAQKVVYKILFIRLILGLAIGIGTIISMNFSGSTLEGFGVLFIMVGINIVLYVPIMKVTEFNESETVYKASTL